MNKQIYYRLIALWVLCEAMLGGIIHGLKIPVSGLIVGSCAVICICLIAWYVPGRGAILKATLIVAIFKMMLSPQAPPPAYIAVFFQGALGELLFFSNRRFYSISCIVLAVLALLESGLQRILVLTIVYGNDLWKVINDFINGLTKQKATTNYSLLIAGGYVLLHFFTGLLVGWIAMLLPHHIEKWSTGKQYMILVDNASALALAPAAKKRKRLKKGLFFVWIVLIGFYVQSYFNIGNPLLPSHMALKILLRSFIIVLGWIFIAGPLLRQLLHSWLQKKKTGSKEDVEEVLRLIPALQQLVAQSWKQSAEKKGWKRISHCSKMILVNALSPFSFRSEARREVYILTAPIQSGKTSSLVSWSETRDDVYGIMTPVADGKRIFMNAHSRQVFLMEAKKDETEVFTVGRFIFSKTNFTKAIRILREEMYRKGWLVIDEIGPLELDGGGFCEVLKEILAVREGKILLVVRETLLEKVKEYFRIGEAQLITDVTLIKKLPG